MVGPPRASAEVTGLTAAASRLAEAAPTQHLSPPILGHIRAISAH